MGTQSARWEGDSSALNWATGVAGSTRSQADGQPQLQTVSTSTVSTCSRSSRATGLARRNSISARSFAVSGRGSGSGTLVGICSSFSTCGSYVRADRQPAEEF
jgi:hypothetical protein